MQVLVHLSLQAGIDQVPEGPGLTWTRSCVDLSYLSINCCWFHESCVTLLLMLFAFIQRNICFNFVKESPRIRIGNFFWCFLSFLLEWLDPLILISWSYRIFSLHVRSCFSWVTLIQWWAHTGIKSQNRCHGMVIVMVPENSRLSLSLKSNVQLEQLQIVSIFGNLPLKWFL